MWVFRLGLISGVMVGLELKFLEEEAPFVFSLVLDIFIVRLLIQKMKFNVR